MRSASTSRDSDYTAARCVKPHQGVNCPPGGSGVQLFIGYLGLFMLTEKGRNGLYRTVKRCSYCTDRETETDTVTDVNGFETHFIGSVPLSVSVNAPLITDCIVLNNCVANSLMYCLIHCNNHYLQYN